MKYTMEDFMKEAPAIALQNIENRKKITKKFVDAITGKNYRQICFVASGSSYNIASNAKYFVQKYLEIEVKVVWAHTFLYHDIDIVDDNTLVVFMSQSGHSTNTIGAAKMLKERNINAIALSNFTDSPLKNEVKVITSYHSTLNDLFVSKGLIISTLFIMLSAIEAALLLKRVEQEEYQQVIEQLVKAVNKLDEVRNATMDFYQKNIKLCQSIYRMVILGSGPTFATALEGCLKMQETYGCAATAFECDEFAHGPKMEIKKDCTVFVLDAEVKANVHYRMLQSYEAAKKLTDRVILITSDASVTGDYIIHIADDGIEDNIAVLYLVCPFQYFAHKICEDLRVSAWDRAVLSYNAIMNTKIPGVRY